MFERIATFCSKYEVLLKKMFGSKITSDLINNIKKTLVRW
jgi:hypothetical protein